MGCKIGLLLAFALLLTGCGPSHQVTVGDPHADPGVIRHDIDVAKDVQTAANERVARGESEVAAAEAGIED